MFTIVAMVQHPIDERSCHDFNAQDLSPLLKALFEVSRVEVRS
jgi:hypothetical protein